MTLTEACREWVRGFNAIPASLLSKLNEEITEITPPSVGDQVYVYDNKYDTRYGEIISRETEEDDVYLIRLDGCEEEIHLKADEFEVVHEDFLPIWGTMWTFDDVVDEEWANGEYLGPHLQEMADCGFRIYEQEDLGIVFGIDGAGYDFYEAHWLPLYKARGLHWHTEDDTVKEKKSA